MPLLQVLLVLAILAVVAVVAAGYGDRLRDAAPERPDLTLPEGTLRGADVDRLEFTLALRGYRQEEVDEALDRLASQLREHDARIAELSARLSGSPDPSGQAEGVDQGGRTKLAEQMPWPMPLEEGRT